MEYRQLGRTGLKVSLIGLGTMTFGEQNPEAEGRAPIDRALDCGVNYVDLYQVHWPGRATNFFGAPRPSQSLSLSAPDQRLCLVACLR